MAKIVRLIPFSYYPGYFNMSADEYLIFFYKKNKVPVLRLYGWNPPAISIGRFQNFKDIKDKNINIVRRITGGGAIFHKNELTYSLVCDEKDFGLQNLSIKESYEKLNKFLIKMYEKFYLKPDYAKNINKNTNNQSLFCFSSNEEYDIIIENKKIGGNAQKRLKNIIFQHGSIPIKIDIEEIKIYFKENNINNNFIDLFRLLKRNTSIKEIEKNLLDSFKEIFNIKFFIEDFNEEEKIFIKKIEKEKHKNDKWIKEGKYEKTLLD